MSRVALAVYDLSRGMAAQLSQAILGQRIEGIWHTGIVVFGNEYFFGGGIQVLPTGVFGAQNNMPPVQMLDMGATNKSLQELENYLRSINNQFTQATYDLINNNCNNFADNVCNFLTGHGIPGHIVNLPRIVFSTPGGVMLRPMIEGMQNQIRQQGSGMDPFGAGPAPSPSFESSLSNSIGSTLNTAAAAAAAPRPTVPVVPAKANLEELPLISGDTSTVRAISNKIINLPVTEGAEKGSALTAEEKQELELILTRLTDKSSTVQFSAASYALIQRLLTNYPATHMSCLFILRLMLLVDTYTDFNSNSLLELLLNMLSRKEAGFSTIPAYAMGICSLSNYLSNSQGVAYLSKHADAVVDVVLSGLSHERSEIRQMSVTLAYNFTLAFTREGKLSGLWAAEGASAEELSSQALQLLCCCLEGIITETDITVRRRRLAVVCRLFRAYRKVASDFVSDLGFADVLQIMNSGDVTPKLTPDEVSIVGELVSAYR